ncbi:MAG: GH36-type glycosyl hydrolase domain-containing protein [Verrucomicrobiota bacterium]
MDARSTVTVTPSSRHLRSARGFALRELSGADGLRVQLLPTGAPHAWRHRETLINQLLPGPAEDGLCRLLVRWLDSAGRPIGWAPLVGSGLAFGCDDRTATWQHSPAGCTLGCTTTLALHPDRTAWAWRLRLRNTGAAPLRIDALLAQDLGLAPESAVRNNEAYTSHYIDLLPVADTRLGHVVLARQNQSAGGRHPWLACACANGAAAHCTDGWQFFGADHRLTGEPAAVRAPSLPSQRLQYEFALAGLQSRPVELAAGTTAEIVFLARYLADHPAASGASDLAGLHELLPATWIGSDATVSPATGSSVFTSAPWLHGEAPTAADCDAWFPGARRHVEQGAGGRLLSFFHGENTHVVTRAKEALVARPHGHVLRSGGGLWPDELQFGLTCYAAGVFGAQSYLGNPSLARLLSVVRNQLNVARAHGQRIFLRHQGAWHQLGVPSAFALEPGRVRWLYRLPDGVIEARVWCSDRAPASFLELRSGGGGPREFLVTHQLALGANEFDTAGELAVHANGWIAARPDPAGFTAKHQPGLAFALAATEPALLAACGGDELLYADGRSREGPYAAFRTAPVASAAFLMLGTLGGAAALGGAVAAARAEYADAAPPARPPAPPLRMRLPSTSGTSSAHPPLSSPASSPPASASPTPCTSNPLGYLPETPATADSAAVGRLDEVLPWFAHNACIHFSAPHGLEQYGGGAWGVRDVCQGSLEWLLAAGDLATVRRILGTVFAQQYAGEPGGWPQWFMFPPFRFIQQVHSHGDVCFWPVKALCDYVETANDPGFLATTAGYTDPERFTPVGPEESLWAHCDRIVALCESRFVPGTALVNYGDGDWDDTLQPADPAMRTRMVSTWTVALAYQTFGQLAEVSRRAGETARAARLERLRARMRADFSGHAMPDGVVAGFLVHEADRRFRPLLHPADRVTGIRYRLLPMTRSMLAGLFTAAEARRHATLIEQELRFADGVHLMSEPAAYHGGLEKLFKRADTAANVGREIGLQYVHAHIRYAEAMARLGDAERLWTALQVVNPVGLEHVLPGAAPRQANVYFSSSDADFADRNEAVRRWPELRAGRVAVRGGWRLYSSGPGLYLHKIRSCLLGVRESFGDVVFDPVLPRSLDGLVAELTLLGCPVRITYRVRRRTSAPDAVTVNGRRLPLSRREPNPYRPGGARIAAAGLAPLLQPAGNQLEIEL